MIDADVEELISPEAEEKALQEETSKLEEEITAVKKAENVSTACGRICSEVEKRQEQDGFLDSPDSGEGKNPYHSTPPTASSGSSGGCCVIL